MTEGKLTKRGFERLLKKAAQPRKKPDSKETQTSGAQVRIYSQPWPVANVEYRSCQPTNLIERGRLWLGRLLIRWGRQIIPFNETVKYTIEAS